MDAQREKRQHSAGRTENRQRSAESERRDDHQARRQDAERRSQVADEIDPPRLLGDIFLVFDQLLADCRIGKTHEHGRNEHQRQGDDDLGENQIAQMEGAVLNQADQLSFEDRRPKISERDACQGACADTEIRNEKDFYAERLRATISVKNARSENPSR